MFPHFTKLLNEFVIEGSLFSVCTNKHNYYGLGWIDDSQTE